MHRYLKWTPFGWRVACVRRGGRGLLCMLLQSGLRIYLKGLLVEIMIDRHKLIWSLTDDWIVYFCMSALKSIYFLYAVKCWKD